MAEEMKTIAKRLSAMFCDDGDSRDSGYSDTASTDDPCRIPASATMFAMSDDFRDMEEVFQSDDFNDSNRSSLSRNSTTSILCDELPTFLRVNSVDNNNDSKENAVSRTTEVDAFPQPPRLHRSSTLHLPRKRAAVNCDDEHDILDAKRVRGRILTAIENDTPPSRKFGNKNVLAIRNFSRIKSTSILEVKPHQEEEKKDPVPEIVPTLYHLPIMEVKDCSMAYRRLEPHILANMMVDMTPEQFRARYILIDCRYPYEFQGGHIRNAVNVYEQSNCSDFFFADGFDSSRIPIFYCEFSQKRGPSMAAILRKADRSRNLHRYPVITFNEIYVLDRGYKGFFEWVEQNSLDSRLCTPFRYIRMDDERFSAQLRTFPFHKKHSRAPSIKIQPKQQSKPRALRQSISISPQRSRRHLFKSKTTHFIGVIKSTVEPLVKEPEEEESQLTAAIANDHHQLKLELEDASPMLNPVRLNFSLSSPETSFLL